MEFRCNSRQFGIRTRIKPVKKRWEFVQASSFLLLLQSLLLSLSGGSLALQFFTVNTFSAFSFFAFVLFTLPTCFFGSLSLDLLLVKSLFLLALFPLLFLLPLP